MSPLLIFMGTLPSILKIAGYLFLVIAVANYNVGIAIGIVLIKLGGAFDGSARDSRIDDLYRERELHKEIIENVNYVGSGVEDLKSEIQSIQDEIYNIKKGLI